MPKMKTKKSAAKRFRVRPGGTVKRGQALPKKAPKASPKESTAVGSK